MKYSAAKGWTGGEADRLYAIIDKRTGAILVRPGNAFRGIGPEVKIRHALRSEAEAEWQSPLHAGWKVDTDLFPGTPMPAITFELQCDGCGSRQLSSHRECPRCGRSYP